MTEIKLVDKGEVPSIPLQLREAKRWLLWRLEKDENNSDRTLKVPYYTNGKRRRGTLDTPEDLARLATYAEAKQAIKLGEYTGLGFALGKDGDGFWQGIDLDKVTANGNNEIAESLPSYVELSPSGKGVHALGYGSYFKNKNLSKEHGWEYYSRAKFFTVTERIIRAGEIVDLVPFIKKHFDPELNVNEVSSVMGAGTLILSPEQLLDIERALKFIDPDCPRDTWIEVCFSLARVETGYQLFSEWSKRSAGIKHSVANEKELEDQWNDIHTNTRGEIGLGTLYYLASKNSEYERTTISENILNDLDKDKRKVEFLERFKPVQLSYDYLPEPDWVIDGFIGEGITFIAGAEGKGKSSILLPLALQVAGLTNDTFLKIKHRRRVIYITEDHSQADRICYGMRTHHSSKGKEEWDYWINVVPAFRMTDKEIQFAAEFAKQYIVTVNGRQIPPLVVFDTASATFVLENENDNSEAARLMSVINNEFWYRDFIPAWISGHTSKALSRTSAIEDLSARGASAWGGNATGTAFIFEDENVEGRILATKKKRFSETIQEVRAVLDYHKTRSKNRYGDVIDESPYYSVRLLESNLEERKEISEDKREQSDVKQITDALYRLTSNGAPITRRQLSEQVHMSEKYLTAALESVVSDGVVIRYRIDDPERRKALNLNVRQTEFLRLKDGWFPTL